MSFLLQDLLFFSIRSARKWMRIYTQRSNRACILISVRQRCLGWRHAERICVQHSWSELLFSALAVAKLHSSGTEAETRSGLAPSHLSPSASLQLCWGVSCVWRSLRKYSSLRSSRMAQLMCDSERGLCSICTVWLLTSACYRTKAFTSYAVQPLRLHGVQHH